MAVALKENGTEVSHSGTATSVTLSPAYPAATVAKDLNILTVSSDITPSSVATPAGWRRVIEGIAEDYESGESRLITIFSRKGALVGTQDVVITRPSSDGTVVAAIDTYERATGKTWSIVGYQEEYEYTDEESIVHTGTNVFVTLGEIEPSITIVFNESTSRPGFDITVTAVDDYEKITIKTVDPTGAFADLTVRGANDTTLTGDIFTVTDYEFANFDQIVYRFEFYTDGVLQDTLESEAIEYVPRDYYESLGLLPMLNSWLRSVNIPSLSIPCFISELKQRDQEGRVLNESKVLGKKFPVVATDKTGSRTGTLTFFVGVYNDPLLDNRSTGDAGILLEQGDVMLLSHLDAVILHEDPTYIVAKSVTRERMGVYDHAIFRYDIEYVEVERPATNVRVLDRSWQEVKDNNISWQLVRSSHENWLQVLLRP